MEPTSRSEWERLPDDPDPQHDLGYVRATMSVVRTENGKGHYLFLPEGEGDIRDEAFIIADEKSVWDLPSFV